MVSVLLGNGDGSFQASSRSLTPFRFGPPRPPPPDYGVSAVLQSSGGGALAGNTLADGMDRVHGFRGGLDVSGANSVGTSASAAVGIAIAAASGADVFGNPESDAPLYAVDPLLGDAGGLGTPDGFSAVDLAGALLTGGRTVANLLPQKQSSLAPVAAIVPGDARDETVGGNARPSEEPAPWINFVVGLDDTIHRPPRVPSASRPGARQDSGPLGDRLAAFAPPLLADGPEHPAPPVSGEALTGLLVALVCGALSRTPFSDPAPAERRAELPCG
jgi:hypothetical protein